MDERNDSGEVVLSAHERVALLLIEAKLSGDRRLARRMGHPGSRRLGLPLAVAALACASLVLLIMGISTSAPVFAWSFAALWPCTLLLAIRLRRRTATAQDHATLWP